MTNTGNIPPNLANNIMHSSVGGALPNQPGNGIIMG